MPSKKALGAPHERPKTAPTGGTRTNIPTSLAREAPTRLPEAFQRLPRSPVRLWEAPKKSQEATKGPQATPKRRPQAPHKIMFPDGVPGTCFMRAPPHPETMLPKGLPGTWFVRLPPPPKPFSQKTSPVWALSWSRLSWGPLGPSWRPLGPSSSPLGLSWGRLGGLLGRFGTISGASLGRLGASGSRKGQNTQIFQTLLKNPGVEFVQNLLGGHVEASWSVFGASRAVFKPSWIVVGLPRAVSTLS